MTADKILIRPVAETYQSYVPQVIRTGISNALINFKMLPSAILYLLQGKISEASISTQRFLINSTLGILGFFDAASNFEITPVNTQSFDQTLQAWGYTPSDFVVLPLLGASTVRGVIALPVDSLYLNPVSYLDYLHQYAPYFANATQVVSKRAQVLQQDSIITNSIDPYATYRSIYNQVTHSEQHQRDKDAAAELFMDDHD